MTLKRRYLVAVAAVVVAATGGWLLFVAVPRWYEEPAPVVEAAPAAAPAEREARKIKATLYYVSGDGLRLVGVEREVPYGDGTVEQSRRIMEELLGPAPASYASAIPAGTRIRALFVTDRGEAFIDFSREISANHPGGSLEELFTVYAIVDALTTNLPAITGVQILVEGQEVDTLAGHIDLRHPLRKNLRWVESPGAAAPAADTGRPPTL
jgi:hypothetical protein